MEFKPLRFLLRCKVFTPCSVTVVCLACGGHNLLSLSEVVIHSTQDTCLLIGCELTGEWRAFGLVGS